LRRRRIALIGDASRCVDAITGEGLGLGFKQAPVLASAIAAGDLRLYERAHRKIVQRPWMMAKVLLQLDRSPGLRARVTHVFEARPQIFAHFLAAHLGVASEARLAAAGASLAWHMLTSA
jgi:flavin-dependent dehydrogenase